MKLLFSRIGKTYSPISGKIVKRHSVTDVVEHICQYPDETRMIILAPISIGENGSSKDKLEELVREGFSRVEVGDQII